MANGSSAMIFMITGTKTVLVQEPVTISAMMGKSGNGPTGMKEMVQQMGLFLQVSILMEDIGHHQAQESLLRKMTMYLPRLVPLKKIMIPLT